MTSNPRSLQVGSFPNDEYVCRRYVNSDYANDPRGRRST